MYRFLNAIRYLTKLFIYSLEMYSINHISPLRRLCFINSPGLSEWIKFKHASLKSCLTLRASRGRSYYYVRGSILSSLLPASLHKNSKARTGDRILRGNPLSSDIRNYLGGKVFVSRIYAESIFLLHHAKPHASLLFLSLFFSSFAYFPRRSHESLRISCDTPASNTLAISRPVFLLVRSRPINTCLAALCEHTSATLANWSFFHNTHDINYSSIHLHTQYHTS